MSISFTRSREQIARKVLRKLGVLASGGSDVSADMDIVYEAADLRLKEMHRRGIFFYAVPTTPATFSVGAGIVSASATSDILFPIALTYTDVSYDQPVQLIGVVEYAQLQDKGRTGTPQKAFWRGGVEFMLYPVPTANGTCKLTYERVTTDSSASVSLDMQVAQIRWMVDILAYDIADEFQQSEQKIQRLAVEAQIAERNIRSLNSQRVNLDTVQTEEDRFEPRYQRSDYGFR